MRYISCQDRVFRNIEAVIFDKDGTLEDSQSFWRKMGIQRARLIDAQVPGTSEPLLMAWGILEQTLDPRGLMAVGSRYENEIAAAAYIAETGRSWLEAKQIAANAFNEASKSFLKTSETAPLFADSLTLLPSLVTHNIKLGIISADSSEGVNNFITNHQLEKYIQLAMGSDGTIGKPEPQLFIQACSALGVEPAKTLMIGDSQGDIEMAKSAGARAGIGICRNSNYKHELNADVLVNSLSEIKVLRSIA